MAKRRHKGVLLAATLVASAILIAHPGPARADDDPPTTQQPKLQSAETNAKQAIGADEVDGPTILEGIPALNGLDAVRDILRDRDGIYLHGEYLGDPYASTAGGLKRGATYSGRLDIELDLDTDKIAGLAGGTLHANMFQIHGRDLSGYYIGNFLSIDDIGGQPTTLLYELWYEQKFGDKLALRVGQQGIDVEFLTSNYAGNFINATFGWPGLPTEDLADGGPAYPLATPAVRVKLDPTRNWSILAAAFDGEPAGPCSDDPETCDRSGVDFRVSDPPLVIVESQIRINQGASAPLLPGTLKLGAFEHFGHFTNQHFGTDDVPSAPGANTNIPLALSPGTGLYAIIDQQILRVPGDDPTNGIGVFARIIYAPSTRSPVTLYADGGFSALGLVPGRSDDLFGVAAAIGKISASAIRAGETPGDLTAPARSVEAIIEVTYQAQLIPGIALQPTVQYIIHPDGDLATRGSRASTLARNAVVLGLTTAVRF